MRCLMIKEMIYCRHDVFFIKFYNDSNDDEEDKNSF